MKDRSLVIFTTLLQTAVGAFVILSGMRLTWTTGLDPVVPTLVPAFWLVGLPITAGMLASFFHLGTPAGAYRVFFNWKTSWLSREIFFTVLFAFGWALFIWMLWQKPEAYLVQNLLAGLTAISGMALVYCMGRVYMLRTVPPWNSRFTLASFLITAFMLGGLYAGMVLTLAGSSAGAGVMGIPFTGPELEGKYQIPALLAGAALALQFLATPLETPRLASRPSPVKLASGQGFNILLLRLSFLLLGAVPILDLLIQEIALFPSAFFQAGLAFVLVFFAEVIGRTMFYEQRLFSGL